MNKLSVRFESLGKTSLKLLVLFMKALGHELLTFAGLFFIVLVLFKISFKRR